MELSPVKQRHGRILALLTFRMTEVVERDRLGEVYAGDVGFILKRNPDTVRAPDLSFIRKERLPPVEAETFSDVVPDLAAEVLSPSDRWGDVEKKISQFLGAGVRVVWVVDPAKNEVKVYRPDRLPHILGKDDVLTEPEILPSFRMSLAELFR